MIGSSLYFIALLATAELEVASPYAKASDFAKASSDRSEDMKNPTPETTCVTIESNAESVAQEIITPVTITNSIEPSMLSYKHWTGTYSPDVFTVYINDTTIEPGQTYTLTDSKTPVVIRFDYSFMNGMRKGTKTTTYKINEQTTAANLTFSWLDTHKTLLDNATIAPEAV